MTLSDENIVHEESPSAAGRDSLSEPLPEATLKEIELNRVNCPAIISDDRAPAAQVTIGRGSPSDMFTNSPPLSAYRPEIGLTEVHTPGAAMAGVLSKRVNTALLGVFDNLQMFIGIVVGLFIGIVVTLTVLAMTFWLIREYAPSKIPPPMHMDPQTSDLHALLTFLPNSGNLGEVLRLLPYAVLGSLIAVCIASD